MLTLLKNIDKKLLPRGMALQYGPYIWLMYLSIFIVSLSQYHPIAHSFIYAAIGISFFLVIYFHGFWASAKNIKYHIGAITVIGTLMTFLNGGASVFFVYAGSFCCRIGSGKKAFIALFSVILWIGLFSWLFEHGPYFYIPAISFTLFIGVINIYQHDIELKRVELKLSQQEIKHLAKTAERERIARDLHDLIGHTFSVITLKAELTNKLIDKDINKAKLELKSLENISRDALSQVREVVTGYRTSDLKTELAHAKFVLESNDISFKYQLDEFDLNEQINKELAIILKELVTNVLKHAQANNVNASITKSNNKVVFIVNDDGKGFSNKNTQSENQQGFGLKGIAERVGKLKGKLSIESSSGTTTSIHIKLAE